ncbi:chalcone isomerase family protein [Marinobacteraceae bacterium S3BR75-40.1]
MKKLVTSLVLSLSMITGAQAAKVSGVEIPDMLKADSTELKLNGAGVRDKWFIDIYVGGLYLPKASQDAKSIISAQEPQAIKLHMVSGLIDSEKMTNATIEGFEKSTGGNMAPIQKQIDAFINVFKEEMNEGDVYDIVYVPEKGVEVYKNGELKDTIDGGMEFKKALFGIWLSDEPAHEGLKESMLGLED